MTIPKPRVVVFIIAAVIFLAFSGSPANALYFVNTSYLTEQQLADLKDKSAHGDINAAKQLASLYLRGFDWGPCDNPGSKEGVLESWRRSCPTKKIASDYIEAFKYMKPVADAGDAWAQTYMGWFYYKGKGVSQDYASALKWFQLAANQGYPYAEDLIGRMYRDGHGVPQNYPRAAEFFEKAALQYTGSNWRLASLYFTGGPGFPQDYEKAYFWQLISASGWPNHEELVLAMAEKGYEVENLMSLNGLWKRLTPAQIEKVKKQIKDYKMPPPTKWSPGISKRLPTPPSNQAPSQPNNLQGQK